MTEKVNKKEQAFALFDEGKTPSSPEIKALKLKGTTKYNYHLEWQKNRGIPTPSPKPANEAKPINQTKGETKPISEAKGEGKVISEFEMVVELSKEVREGDEEVRVSR